MRISSAASMLLASVLTWVAAGQAPATAPIDFSKLGPAVGQKAPDFSLTDQTGTPRNLQSVLGPNGALLVFYRSAEW
jgi:hypothetical protein